MILAVAFAAAQQSPAIALPQVFTSGSIGLTSGQSARWNALNPPWPAPIVAPTCSVTLSFASGSGEVLKQETVALKAGESRSLLLDANEFPSTGNPTGIYALAVLPVTGPADQPTPRSTCTLVTNLEVVDSSTGRTTVVLGGSPVRPTGLLPASTTP